MEQRIPTFGKIEMKKTKFNGLNTKNKDLIIKVLTNEDLLKQLTNQDIENERNNKFPNCFSKLYSEISKKEKLYKSDNKKRKKTRQKISKKRSALNFLSSQMMLSNTNFHKFSDTLLFKTQQTSKKIIKIKTHPESQSPIKDEDKVFKSIQSTSNDNDRKYSMFRKHGIHSAKNLKNFKLSFVINKNNIKENENELNEDSPREQRSIKLIHSRNGGSPFITESSNSKDNNSNKTKTIRTLSRIKSECNPIINIEQEKRNYRRKIQLEALNYEIENLHKSARLYANKDIIESSSTKHDNFIRSSYYKPNYTIKYIQRLPKSKRKTNIHPKTIFVRGLSTIKYRIEKFNQIINRPTTVESSPEEENYKFQNPKPLKKLTWIEENELEFRNETIRYQKNLDTFIGTGHRGNFKQHDKLIKEGEMAYKLALKYSNNKWVPGMHYLKK